MRQLFACILILNSIVCKYSVHTLDTTKTVKFVYNSDVSLACDSSEDSKFYATSNANVVTEISASTDPLKYTIDGKVLSIKNLKKKQIQSTYICNSTSDQTTFVNEVVPYLYQIETQTIVIIEDYKGELDCHLLVGNDSGEEISWSWKKNKNSLIESEFVYFNRTSNATYSKLVFVKLALSNAGIYECTATNSFGSFSRTMDLRVKSKLAPIWPFLGIVAEALILVVLIVALDTSKKNDEVVGVDSNDNNNNKLKRK